MEFKKIIGMNAGDERTSYANNSGLQRVVVSKTWPILDETLEDMIEKERFPECCFKMVDLGCASGPNTLLVISHIMDIFQDLSVRFQEIQIFLNDLPDNDFNNLFKLVQSFYDEKAIERSRCCIYGLPGSFYGRLFPDRSLHFAYSSYSVHWLSQVPEGLDKHNKENIYMATTSPREVLEAYGKQFRRDFSKFLSLRGEEMVSGGRMVLSFIGRTVEDPSSMDDNAYFTMLAETLHEMVAEGIIRKDDLHSFNVPVYTPFQQEAEAIIINEGSFELFKKDVFRVRWDAHGNTHGPFFDEKESANLVANCIRALSEPMLASHFGSCIKCDDVFERYARKVAAHMSKQKSSYYTMVISLRRK
ncbi:benzoate carboxyl methyltransferase-like [Primulina huaijiensis]|uniref:benzoate carboxyl methyltransferase-like n=1 Tax=Primulina huaijiensis TaxID=1492673 RepID=UPI003CC71829